jgi:hypothetical protein
VESLHTVALHSSFCGRSLKQSESALPGRGLGQMETNRDDTCTALSCLGSELEATVSSALLYKLKPRRVLVPPEDAA